MCIRDRGLRIIKGLFRRKPVQAVGFALQRGKVKQLRRCNGLFLFFKRSANGLRFLASRFHLPRRRFVVLPFGDVYKRQVLIQLAEKRVKFGHTRLCFGKFLSLIHILES